MTRPRYLIAVAEDERLLKQARAMLDRAAGPAFRLILDEQRVLLMTCGEQALAVPGVGAVIGPVHDPNGVVGAGRLPVAFSQRSSRAYRTVTSASIGIE